MKTLPIAFIMFSSILLSSVARCGDLNAIQQKMIGTWEIDTEKSKIRNSDGGELVKISEEDSVELAKFYYIFRADGSMEFPLGDKIDRGVYRLATDAKGNDLLLQGTPTITASNNSRISFEDEQMILEQVEFLPDYQSRFFAKLFLTKK